MQRRNPVRTPALPLLAVVLALALSACATGPRVATDADPTADFSAYRTYAFYQPIAMEQSGYTSYLSDRIKQSVRREMDARGYRFDAEDPDLRVNFQGYIREEQDVYSVPRSDVQYFYSYRARTYFAVPVWYDQTRVSRYTVGTLTIDLVDAERNHLVWTGDAIGRVTQRTPEQRATAADQAVAAIFAQYPFVAGSGATRP
ncbi:hypothetical protein N799_00975 [Lysobacter arseniciresistens ZS79]|uniref:DUF4136 domain-containing protein n=1 Tax=Lysobacter arseniciresistens ZS79 TaxID=913325 RepID=A0A0A0F5Y4_9GAMM|nr:DUF4136 domain-containing protein [Lysobacter arseniciresistens]KGM57773.1 hypothetical protein N799_00975 [Lysobacter arseniciresistens ZS79]